jgi:nicotinamide-nucleotide amidase
MEKNETQLDKVFTLLASKKLTMSTCESFTGGAFANEITNKKGSSIIFKGSLVCYANEAKIAVANVKKRTIKKYGAISAECSQEMATNTNKILKTNLCVSFTGNADTDVIENTLPFFGYISIAFDKDVRTYEINGTTREKLNRELFKQIAIEFAMNKILELIK